METPSERILIVDEADDVFSTMFEDYARRQGVSCRRCRLDEIARWVTIEQEGCAVSVTPRTSLLLRPLRSVDAASDEVLRWTWGEWFATVWSAACITSTPVINRPGPWGWANRAPFSAALTEWRANSSVESAEAFWRDLAPPEAEAMLHQDLSNWLPLDEPPRGASVRSRALPKCRGWEQVIVVGEEAFRVTSADLGGWEVESESIGTAARLGLDFATISWGVPADGAKPVLARVSAFPSIYECIPVWNDVAAALLRRLAP